MEYICIGKVINTFGIKGQLKIDSYSDFDALRYQKGNTVYLFDGKTYLPFIVSSFQEHKGYSLVTFQGYEDINKVLGWKGYTVFITDDKQTPLPKGEYYVHQLIGCKVVSTVGETIGTVLDVEETNGAQNNLRVQKTDGKTCLIPNVEAFVKSIDMEEKTIVVEVIEGLL